MSFNLPELASDGPASLPVDTKDTSLVTVYDVKTRQPLQLPAGEATQKLLSGEAGLPKDSTVTMVGPKGETISDAAHSIDLHQAVNDGFRLQSDIERHAQKAAEEEAAKPENQGVHGATRAAFFGGLDALSLGTMGSLAAADTNADNVAIRQKLDEDHHVAHAVGELAGTVAALPLMGGVGAIGDAAGAAVAGEGAGLGTRIAGQAANFAAQGAALAAPRATIEAAVQRDPEKAAETMLWGIGTGAVLGAGSKALGEGASAAGKGISRLAEYADTEEGQAALKAGLGKAVHTGLKYGLGAVGMSHGPVGAAVGMGAGHIIGNWIEESGLPKLTDFIKGLAKQAPEEGFGAALANHGVNGLQQRLDEVPALLTRAAASKAPKSDTVSDPVKQLLGKEASGLSKTQQLQRLSDNLSAAADDIDGQTQKIAALTTALHLGGAADTSVFLAQKMSTAIDYLNASIPKPPGPPAPFSGPSTWKPTDQQLLAFNQKAQVVVNPMSVFSELQKGTLTSNHIDALKSVYPKVYSEIVSAIFQAAGSGKAPELSTGQMTKLSLLLDQPLTPIQQPSAMASLQQVYSAPAASGNQKATPAVRGTKALKDMPSLATSTQQASSALRS